MEVTLLAKPRVVDEIVDAESRTLYLVVKFSAASIFDKSFGKT